MVERELEGIISERNLMSMIFKVIAWFIFVICIIGGCILAVVTKRHMDNNFWYGFFVLIASWGIGSFSFLLVYTVSEIIQILHDIRKKIWMISAKMK